MKLLNVAETAELLNIKTSTLYTWVHYKKIPHIKLYGKLCFEYEGIVTFINANKILI